MERYAVKQFLLLFLIAFSSLFGESKGTVVCIHGFLGAPWNMRYIEKKLNSAGYTVHNWGYKSRKETIKTHGENLVSLLTQIAENDPGAPINFSAHSMGSLVLLAALNEESCPKEAKQGKIVLIAPPLQGASWGRKLNKSPVFRWIAKDHSGKELMTSSNFNHLGTFPDTPILVIAGTFGLNPFLKGENDGTVLIEETALEVPHKRVHIKRGHKSILFSKKVFDHLLSFLEN